MKYSTLIARVNAAYYFPSGCLRSKGRMRQTRCSRDPQAWHLGSEKARCLTSLKRHLQHAKLVSRLTSQQTGRKTFFKNRALARSIFKKSSMFRVSLIEKLVDLLLNSSSRRTSQRTGRALFLRIALSRGASSKTCRFFAST